MKEKLMIVFIIFIHLFAAFMVLKYQSNLGIYLVGLFYLYGFFERPIKRIIKHIIQVSKDSSLD